MFDTSYVSRSSLSTRADARTQERPPLPIELDLPYDSKVFFLGAPAYGNPAQVIGHDANDTLAIRVAVRLISRVEAIY